MAVVIRMKRTGRRNRPCYRITVADSQFPCDGRTLDTLGIYDPVSKSEDLQLRLDVEKAKEWIARGARPSETVASIFRRQGVYKDAVVRPKRTRPGRTKTTATKTARDARKSTVSAAKEARRKTRHDAKYAARKAARAAAAAAETPAE